MRMLAIAFLVFLLLCLGGIQALEAEWIRDGVPVCNASNDQMNPQLISGNAGNVIVVWQDSRTGDHVIYGQQLDYKGSLKWPANGVRVSIGTGYNEDTRLISDGTGGAIVCWTKDLGAGTGDIWAQRIDANGNVLWGANGVPICTADGGQTWQEIISDGTNGAIIMWQDFSESLENHAVYVQRISGSGVTQWPTNGVKVAGSDRSFDPPKITSDCRGGAIIAWPDAAVGNPYKIYAQRIDSTGVSKWDPNGIAISTIEGHQTGLQMVSDNIGGAVIVWENTDIHAQAIDSNGVVRWNSTGIDICKTVHDQVLPQITFNSEGKAIITWVDQRSYYEPPYLPYSAIYAQKIDLYGAVYWTNNGVPICSGYWNTDFPAIVSDGVGGAIISWRDRRTAPTFDYLPGYYDIYAQRVDGNGMSQWTVDGRPVSTATNDQHIPCMMAYDSSGAILAWGDYRNGSAWKVYCQRLDAAGEQPVATLLQDFSASFSDPEIIIKWTLYDVPVNGHCFVLRADPYERTFTELQSKNILREGNSFTFVDSEWLAGSSYVYRIEIDMGNNRQMLFETQAIRAPSTSPISMMNYPNPFNPSTSIRFYLPEKSRISLAIYDIRGNLINLLADGYREQGFHTVEWNGLDMNGNQASSGIYLCRLAVGKERLSRKIVLLK